MTFHSKSWALHLAWAGWFAFAVTLAIYMFATLYMQGRNYEAALAGVFAFPFGYLALMRAKMALRAKRMN